MNDDKLLEELLKRRQAQYDKYIAPMDAVILSLGGNIVSGATAGATKAPVSSTAPANSKYEEIRNMPTIKEKLVAILRLENRFLHVRQFAEILHQSDISLSEDEWRAKASPMLSTLKRDSNGSIVTVVINGSNTNNFWGSKAWLGADGKPKHEYMYDESYIMTGNRIKEYVI